MRLSDYEQRKLDKEYSGLMDRAAEGERLRKAAERDPQYAELRALLDRGGIGQ